MLSLSNLARLLRRPKGPLEKCTEAWGASDIRNHDPAIREFRDVDYLPYREDQPWVIFERSGNIDQILETEIEALPVADEAPDEAYVYCGRFNLHYGHFIVNTLSHFWFLARGNRDRSSVRILMHGQPAAPDLWFHVGFISEIFRYLVLTRANFVAFDRITRIRRLTVPETSFGEQCFVHKVFADLCHIVGAEALRSTTPCYREKPIYLSKTKLPLGVIRIINEPDILNKLDKAGVEIVFPETLSFEEQIKLFAESPVIAGTTGSAFHTSIFVPPFATTIGVNLIPHLNSNYLMIDAINKNKASYYRPRDIVSAQVDNDPFLASKRLVDPLGVADALLHLIDDELSRRARYPGHRRRLCAT
jgi:capsular polysaccharide biosynthesis protein